MKRKKWQDAPSLDGWYWVRLKRPYPKGLYMTLVRKGKQVTLYTLDGTIPSGGQIADVKRAGGKWYGPLVAPSKKGKEKRNREFQCILTLVER